MKSIMLRDTPSNWKIERLGQLFHERKEKVSDKEYMPLSVTKNGIVPQMEHVAKSDDSDNRKRVAVGDFVINSRSDRKGSSGLSDYEGSVSLINIVLEPKHGYPKFLHYLLKSYAFQEEFYRFGHGIVADLWTTRFSELKKIQIALPDDKTQKEITNFLNNEIKRIDLLIEKKQQMITLLAEKSSSIINKTITTGLNSNVQMKDSGLDWIGLIPAGWLVSKVGFETSVKARLGWKGLKAHEYVDDGYIFLSTPNIKKHSIDFENVNYITKKRYFESPEIMLNKGDILLTKDGSTTGTVNIIRNLPKPATVNSSIAVIRPKSKLNSLYAYYFFSSHYLQSVIKRMQGGMGVPHLFQADLRWFSILLPSKEEQYEIGKYLDDTTQKINFVSSKIKSNIKRLKELRSSIITSAVTGRLDIKQWDNKNISDQWFDQIQSDFAT